MHRFCAAVAGVLMILALSPPALQPLAAASTAQGGGVTTPPVLIKAVYPKGGVHEVVEFDCVVLTDGTVQIVQLMKTSNPKLNDAAREALSKWRFKPGTRDGKPIPVRVSIEVSFRPKP